jgi:hypothetical protein
VFRHPPTNRVRGLKEAPARQSPFGPAAPCAHLHILVPSGGVVVGMQLRGASPVRHSPDEWVRPVSTTPVRQLVATGRNYSKTRAAAKGHPSGPGWESGAGGGWQDMDLQPLIGVLIERSLARPEQVTNHSTLGWRSMGRCRCDEDTRFSAALSPRTWPHTD